MRRRRGFSLLEVLVATLIMGIAVVGLLSTMSTSVRNASRVADADRAAMVARSELDRLLADPKLPMNFVIEGRVTAEQFAGREGGWRARVSAFEVPENAAPASPVLQRVEFELWWMDGLTRRTFPIEAYRRAPWRP